MAEGEYFNPGMVVSCTTCHEHKITGEVMAFDLKSRMLIIKSTSTSGKRNENDVRMLNLSFLSDVKVIKEMQEPPPQIPQLNLHKIQQRVRENLDDKQRKVNYINASVPNHAQQLFLAITKTISDVEWDDQDIIVMKEVRISPPYKVENCKAMKNGNAINFIRKIIEKHLREAEAGRRSTSPSS